MDNASNIEQQLRHFVTDNFLFGDGSSLTDETSFLDTGIVDSTGMLELVSYLEQTFAIQVDDAELVPENLDSIRQIAAFVRSKQTKAVSTHAG